MIIEEQKYRADVFKIGGFSLMTPFGKLILEIPNFKLAGLNFQLIIFAIIAFVSAYLGLVLILRGFEALEERRGK